MENRIYMAIDLKSFYASVECVERGLDPLSTNLVVADVSRTEKTICLAVTPSLKAYGVPGRPRLFEVTSKVREINAERRWYAPGRRLVGASSNDRILREDKCLALDYIAAPPRMALYVKYSTDIYKIYLKYFAPEDIHVYSIDEVFIDITNYKRLYKMSPRALAMKVIGEVLIETGITATVGIGTNLYLAKVAMDIVAKHLTPDKNGVRIAQLDEKSYRRMLWEHRPLTDFWRVGQGYARKLEAYGMNTMGDVALKSLENEKLLYKLFGINAELLIDHAWGYEPCTMQAIKSYKPLSKSLSTGQVLHCPYDFSGARLITREMADLLALDMTEKKIVTDQIVLTIGYEALEGSPEECGYLGEVGIDYYGRVVPKHAHGTVNLPSFSSSTMEIVNMTLQLYDKIVDKRLLVRRVNITANNIRSDSDRKADAGFVQLDMFCDYEAQREKERIREENYRKEKRRQRAVIDIKNRYGKNAILKGMNFEDGATTIDRNLQIGGHKA